jgi:photosystem II stability/assembly factor-like uncharacterized protein
MPLRTLYLPAVLLLFVAGLATELLMQSSAPRVEREEAAPEFSLQMRDWMNRLRGRPLHGTLGAARLEALRKRNAIIARLKSHRDAAGPINSSATWTSIGPQPAEDSSYGKAGGRATAIAVDPTNDNVIFVGTSGGGVWRTGDGGQTWSPQTDFQESLAIGSLAIDPTNHQTIYAGTGEEDLSADSYYGIGILKSTDGGNSWALVSGNNNGMTNTHIGSIAVNPVQSGSLLATQVGGTDPSHADGIISSSDGGATWTTSYAVGQGQLGSSVVFDTAGNAYAGVGSNSTTNGATNGVIKLTAGNTTWNTVVTPGNISNLYQARRFEIAVAPSSPNLVYVVATYNGADSAGGFDLLDLIVSKDGFNSLSGYVFWDPKPGDALNFCGPFCWYTLTLAVDPSNPTHVFAGGASSQYSSNGYAGANQLISLQFNSDPTTGYSAPTVMSKGSDGSVPHPDFHGLAITKSQKFYAANDGGVWQLNNYNSSNFTWTSLSGALDTIEFYHLSLDATNLKNGFGGAQDNGLLHYQGNPAWQEVECGDGAFSAIDPVTPSNVYAACAQALFTGAAPIVKSSDGGNTFSSAAVGINPNDTGNFVAPLVMDPSNSTTLYYGTNHLYQSQNGAASWSQLSSCDFGDSTCQNPSTGDTIYSIAVARNDSNTVWVGTVRGLLWVTHNAISASPTFVPVSIPNSSNPLTGYSDAITGIAIDPNNVSDVFVSLAGFDGSRVLNTQDGTNFLDATGGLPAIPMNSIVFDPDLAETLYVATDVGAYYTTNGGTAWTPLGVSLPNVALRAIAFHRSSRTLRAATNGRGMWQIGVGGTPDFGVAAGTLSATSVTPGNSATSTLTVASVNGFNSPVALTCSVAPVTSQDPTCTLSATSLTPNNGSPATSTLTVATTAPIVGLVPSNRGLFLALALIFPTTFVCPPRGPSRNCQNLIRHFLLGVAVAGCCFLFSCGGGSSGGGTSSGGQGAPGTPAGQYTITVLGTAGAITHQQTLTLMVQ